MRRSYNGMMRTIIAVVGRVFVQCIGGCFDDDIEVRVLIGRNVRIERIIVLFLLDRDGRSCLAIEVEHQFLIRAASFGRCFSRLCGL